MAHEIVVCGCPVCHLAGARRLITAFAAALSRDQERSDQVLNIRLRMARLDGVCTKGPNIAIDGVRHVQFQGANVRRIVRELRGPERSEESTEVVRSS